MKKAIRLTAALVAALAFTTVWADEQKCDSKDMPCATAVAQEGSSEESTGSAAGEPAMSDASSNESFVQYQEMVRHEAWESGD